jgi:5-methylcytosine-specific restriction protein A
MPGLGRLTARLPTLETRTTPALEKTAQPIYQTPAYRIWREAVIARAGRRCEAVGQSGRCRKAEPGHRMFADHKHEVRDGGALYDPANGECLCGSHHSAKTAAARAARRWA